MRADGDRDIKNINKEFGQFKTRVKQFKLDAEN